MCRSSIHLAPPPRSGAELSSDLRGRLGLLSKLLESLVWRPALHHLALPEPLAALTVQGLAKPSLRLINAVKPVPTACGARILVLNCRARSLELSANYRNAEVAVS